jgi:TonB family protein
MTRFRLIAVLLSAQAGWGFQGDDTAKKAGPDKYPVPTYRPEPKYTEEGRSAHIQGIVMLQLVVDEQGMPTQISVLSPLGYGLDEAAIEAVTHWRFQPGTKDGKPVKVQARVETTFRFRNESFDPRVEKQRTAYNVALGAVQQGKQTKATIDSLRNLASQKYPPGMYMYGKVLEDGRGVTADPEQGFRFIQESADKKYGPAIYEIAAERLKGGRLDKDPAKGLELMRSAAKLGSRGAQIYLGQAYEKGDGTPVDLDKSRQYFRLCASAGDGVCQFRLGKSLLENSDHLDRDYVQAIAWLQLASEHAIEDAEKILKQEDAHLTPAQVASAKQLMPHLVHTQ